MPLSRLARPAMPNPSAGRYFFLSASATTGTANTLGNGVLRLYPWIVERTLVIDRIGAEITVAGEAGSLLRLGIYRDNGLATPGALVLDAGTIDGTSVTVQDITISALTLIPGFYWVGGAVQAAPTTQPTMRTPGSWSPAYLLGSSALPGANAGIIGDASVSGIQGALPASISTTSTGAGNAPRVHVRTA